MSPLKLAAQSFCPERNVVAKTARIFIVILFLCRAAVAKEFLIDSWTTESGLADNFVTAIAQTPDGYLWIGTYNGLARFDGSRFVTFNPANTPQLEHGRINKLFVDAQGVLWINTYDGSLTSWRKGIFTQEWNARGKNVSEAWMVDSRRLTFSYRGGLMIQRPAGGATNGWTSFLPPAAPPGAFYCKDGAGGLWCFTLAGNLWQIHNGIFLPVVAGLRGMVRWVAPDLSGRIWAGTDQEIARWNGDHFEDMAPAGEPALNVASFYFTRDGGVLVAADGRLRKLLKGEWVSELKPWPELMQDEQLRPFIFEDKKENLWRISRGQGIFYFPKQGAPQQISVADGLLNDHVTCWFEDQEGGIWIGLGHGGLARLRERHLEVIGMPGSLPARAAVSVCEDAAGALWIGTYGGGLNRWRDGELTNFTVPTKTDGDFVFSIFPDPRGQLLMSAGMEDFFIFRDGQWQSPTNAVHAVKSILADSHGRIWLGRKDGVVCWTNDALREWSSHTGSIAKPVRALAEDAHGDIWCGADDGNIYRFEQEKWRAFPLPKFSAQQAVWSLLADEDGSLWIGTSDAGLLHFADGKFTRFTTTDGLPDNIICQILDDHLGNLWLGTYHGIARVGKNSLRAFASGKVPAIACSTYDRSDGLPTLECSSMYQPGAWRAHDGKLWFTTFKGVVGVQPADLPINPRPPPVTIEEFLADGKIQNFTNNENSILKIAPGKQNFEFHFTALSFVDTDKIRFRYRLEGVDSGWVNAGNRRSVQYSYLKPGVYRFQVTAANSDGFWNQTGASIRVQILPHFWETWWFRFLLGLLLTAGVAALALYISHRELRRELERLERQRGIEQDRARIARDIHDHIGSGLTRINLLNELLLGEPAEQLPSRVGQITGVTCELMRAMDEIVWAVNPKNDTLDSLMNYLCDFADEYLRAAGISLRLRVPAPLPAWHLTSETRHNLFLAVKEILNNIVKHSRADEVVLELKLNAHAATLAIHDNGRGFAEKISPGNGLENLQQRAAAIGGRCIFESEAGKGARVEIVLPAPAANGKS
jgi:signal transduction histidine kinase/ligand-binding sensor domain-containing protein